MCQQFRQRSEVQPGGATGYPHTWPFHERRGPCRRGTGDSDTIYAWTHNERSSTDASSETESVYFTGLSVDVARESDSPLVREGLRMQASKNEFKESPRWLNLPRANAVTRRDVKDAQLQTEESSL